MIEDKKFKLTKYNLDLINLIQHTILISISSYKNMSNQDWNDEKIIYDFELLCESYLNLHHYRDIHSWGFSVTPSKKMEMIIYMENSDLPYNLIIDLEKSYYDCCSMSQTLNGHEFGPVTINFFNVEFVHE